MKNSTFEPLNNVLRVLSWGCGVQSTTLAVMSALGDLERLDVIMTAETHWERRVTYKVRGFYIKWLKERGVRVEIVSGGNVRWDGAAEHIHIPFWTSNGGPLRRQCTREFKIRPMKHRIRELLQFHRSDPPHPPAMSVEQWLGISWDESERMKDSRVRYIVNRWPLIEKRMSRGECIKYLEDRDLPVPISSACIGCPYRLASSWLEMSENSPEEFGEAVEFDRLNRHNPLAVCGGSTSDELFIYKHGGPLEDADLEADAKRERAGKQLPLFVCESGHCMV